MAPDALRQAIADQRPDVADPEEWPRQDLAVLAGRLLVPLDIIDALTAVARTTGANAETLLAAAAAIHSAREALSALEQLSPLGTWRLLHPPRLDPLDGIYDCGSPDCPPRGFAGPDDKDLHYRRWGLQ